MYKFLRSEKGFTVVELLICVLILSVVSGVAIPIVDKKQKSQKALDCENNCLMMTTVIQEAMEGMLDNGKKQTFHVNNNHANPAGAQYLRAYVMNWVFVCENYKQTGASKSGFSNDTFMLLPIANNGGGGMVWSKSRTEDYNRAQSHIFLSSTYSNHSHYNWSQVATKLYDIYGSRLYHPSGSEQTEPYMFVISNDDTCVTLGDIRGGYRDSSVATYNDGCKYGAFLKNKELAAVPISKYFPDEEVPVCPFDKSGEYSYFVLIDGTVVCNCPTCLNLKHKYGYKDTPKAKPGM